MKKTKKLLLRAETIRVLASVQLTQVVGAARASGGPDLCPPNTPYRSCTGCQSENVACPSGNGSCDVACTGTLWTFDIKIE